MSVRHALSGVLLATCLACATRPANVGAVDASSIGSHAFRAELPGGVKFLGTMIITEDTIVPRPHDGECRSTSRAPSRQHLVYECSIAGASNVMVALDRSSPLRRSTWGVEAAVRKSRPVCINWRTWENGTRTCTQSQQEDYVERTHLQGPIIFGPP